MLAVAFSACSDIATKSKTEQAQAADEGVAENAPTYLVAMEAAYPPPCIS